MMADILKKWKQIIVCIFCVIVHVHFLKLSAQLQKVFFVNMFKKIVYAGLKNTGTFYTGAYGFYTPSVRRPYKVQAPGGQMICLQRTPMRVGVYLFEH